MGGRADMRAVVRRALHCPHGWTMGRYVGGHPSLVLPNGGRVIASWSPGDVHAARNVAARLSALCGCPSFWNRGGRGRSRQAVPRIGFDPVLAGREQDAWHEAHPERDRMPHRYAELWAEMDSLNVRRDRDRCLSLAREIRTLEDDMDRLFVSYEKRDSGGRR